MNGFYCNSITPSIMFCTISPNDIMSCFEAFASGRIQLFFCCYETWRVGDESMGGRYLLELVDSVR